MKADIVKLQDRIRAADQVLQQNLKTFKGKFVGARAAAVADFNTIGDWEAVRSAGAAIRK